ncbi:MAG: hypothetical protein AAF268_05975 [Cyanobacteria bacterium P01_A01_bin.3]
MPDSKLQSSLYGLLEHHNLEDILFALYRYADTQARLASTVQQTSAQEDWEHKAAAIDVACEAIDTANRGDY